MNKDTKEWEEFDEKFPVGQIGHKHTEECEWTCVLRPNIKSFIKANFIPKTELREWVEEVEKLNDEVRLHSSAAQPIFAKVIFFNRFKPLLKDLQDKFLKE